MRILIVNWRDLDHPLAGGAEVYTDAIAREWAKMGHEVTLFSSAVTGRPTVEMHSNGYTIIRRGSRHGVYRAARRYWKKEGVGNFDLVVDEVNTRPFNVSRYVYNIPVVCLVHQMAREVWFYEMPWLLAAVGYFILEQLWLRPYRNLDVVTVSESSRESLQSFGLRRVRVVPEGFDKHVDRPTVANKETLPTFVFVGRLSSNKRPDHALKAFHLIQQKLPAAQLWVIGDGPMKEKLMASASDKVQFFGRVDEDRKWNLLSRAHVLLITSVREGWGLVVTEAAAMGTPACGYDVPGLRDSIKSSGGELSDQDPEELALTAVDLLKDIPRRGSEIRTGGVLPWKEVAMAILTLPDRFPAFPGWDLALDTGSARGLLEE